MPTKLKFHEQMTGYFARGAKDPRVGDEQGRRTDTTFGFDLEIDMDDLDKFLADPKHTATVKGHYLGNLFGAAQPVLTAGLFNFMSEGPGGSRLMEHHHTFACDGRTYRFDGYKYLDDDPLAFDAIGDLTTLYSTITDAATGEVYAAGVLHFPMRRFPELVASFESSGDDDPVTARTKFLELFLGDELKVLLNGLHDPPPPPTRRRALARSHDALRYAYDVVVVGSGYGGGATAARLASWKDPASGKGRSVCVLERGREWRAGEFPDQPWEFVDALRTPLNPDGLFDFTVGGDISVVVGNGLGGTSLINANVMLEPEPALFALPEWKRLGLPDLAPYYARARAVLNPRVPPAPPLKAVTFQAAAKKAGGAGVETLPLAVAFDTLTRADTGNTQTPCINCGGCVTGCNFTAKSTVDMTYLSIAEKAGAEIFAGVEVASIARDPAGQGYVLHCVDRENGAARLIAARQVVLAAGALGTFGILARSRRDQKLAVPDALGRHFSGNGDVLGFGYNTDEQTAVNVGPTITSVARFGPANGDVRKRYIVEEGGVPQALMALLRKAIPLFVWNGVDTDAGWADKLREWSRKAADLFGLQDRGALSHSQLYFGMGFEDSFGTLELDGDRVKVRWPDVGNQPFAQTVDDTMLAITAKMGGTYIKNPDPRSFLMRQLFTAHPLGGCAMGADAQQGVVDGRGQVFGHAGGLFVADGSIAPTPLGANPALTISALAEYIAEQIQRGWEQGAGGP